MLSFGFRPRYMGLICSLTPILITAIQFKQTNNTDETFQVNMKDPVPDMWQPGFSSQLTPNQTDEAWVRRHWNTALVAWMCFMQHACNLQSFVWAFSLVSSFQAQAKNGVDCCPANQLLLVGGTVYAAFMPGQSPVYYKDGDFSKYNIFCPIHHPSPEVLWPALLRFRISRPRKETPGQ